MPAGRATTARPGDCQEFADDEVPDLLNKVRRRRRRRAQGDPADAPNATVVLVGYLPLLPEPEACPAGVFKGDNQRSTYDVEVAVDDSLRAAAAAAGTEFVSMRDAGRGHGMCAGDDAWVNGLKAAAGDGVIVHPRAVGHAGRCRRGGRSECGPSALSPGPHTERRRRSPGEWRRLASWLGYQACWI